MTMSFLKKLLKHKAKLLISMICIYIFSMLCIVLSGLNDQLFKADIIVVLGNKVSPEGVPSFGLTTRLNKAIEIYQQGYSLQILVSGGTGKEGYDESLAMANFLISRGIPEQAIIRDPQGVNTRATAYATAQYMQANKLTSTIIVSQYYHIARTKLAFKQAGINQIGTGASSVFSIIDIYSVAREIIGYPFYYLKLK